MLAETAAIRPQILPLGQDGMLIRFSLTPAPNAAAAVQVLIALLQKDEIDGVTEIAPSLTSVLLRFDPARTTRNALAATLQASLSKQDWNATQIPEPARRWHVPAAFGGDTGPQLGEAAKAAGVSETQAIAEVTGADLRVLAIGFAPGQPYLGLLPDHWNIPRQKSLTPMVPAGALIVAVRQIILFVAPNTTGWRQIGNAAFRPFQPDSHRPFPLRPGDALRFERVPESEISALRSDPMGGAYCETLT